MTVLLDANVLIALTVADHVHHEPAESWFADNDRFATCPITEGSLVRLLVREGQTVATVRDLLYGLTAIPGHEFWPDELSYRDVDLAGVIGHRQVTDAYLAQLARSRDARLASFDHGLASLHPDVVDLIETRS
ncbi:TA system VapC family ribonuclease toxin [Microlunatus speluncae]|uniref:TA system VapC family ribonuclease toxin n=1 Tax=Microlunatus speluncae TaxID=2594267 RepID=UPI0012660A1E|nr:TA system VapC family ribonuclease toxin [Microlunatus speluncae]